MRALFGRFRKRQKFVIISYPRTGSNLLCSLLDSHPDILCHLEIFHQEAIFLSGDSRALKEFDLVKRDADPLRFLGMIWDEDYGRRLRAVGFKLFFGQNRDVLEHISREKSILKIILYRENMLENYYSRIRAEKSGIWTSQGETSKGLAVEERVSIDPEDFKEYRGRQQAHLSRQVALLRKAGQRFMVVEYEDIVREIENVQRFLGLEPSGLIKTSFRKQTRYGHISDVVENYDEIDALGIVRMDREEFCSIS